MAFVTQNGVEGGGVSDADVDGGPTYLVSPVIDLQDNDATIFYSRWFFSSDQGVEGDEDVAAEAEILGSLAGVGIQDGAALADIPAPDAQGAVLFRLAG